MFRINKILTRHNIYGLLTGIFFGFLLNKGGVTDYNVLVGQLLLEDYTVFKVILTAILTGMIGIYFLKSRSKVDFDLKEGSIGSLITGGLIFGIGFGLLGYCPGTIIGAVGQGSIDALIGGVPGIILGAAFYAHLYPKIQNSFFEKQQIRKLSFTQYFKLKTAYIVGIFSIIFLAILIIIELID